MSGIDRAPGLDPSVPNSARIYNYMLGGKDNYPIDRQVAHRLLSVAPDTKILAWFVRKFMVHAVELAADARVKQFIDLGSGIPASPNVHEVAREIHPTARVVYVDNDLVACRHCEALLARPRGVSVVQGDIRSPQQIIDQIDAESLIDFSRPVAVLIVGVLHYVMDEEYPGEIIAAFRDVMAPGSYLVVAHATDDTHPEFQSQTQSETDNTSAQLCYRSTSEIETLMKGFELLSPGIAPVQQFLGSDLPTTRLAMHGGIGRRTD
ncbi:SAM-dependent methyltransferase [Nocardia brasiliensis]|uniref:SAM-dependent methyltransferase n=1 Tax=Nocardia brasiliensis TaxID=37326 RepID=UPI0004A77148|nr:SAM-dependent methyltransferase [Nocardia brasiliensis]